MKYAYVYDGSKHELKEFEEETDEQEVPDYQSCVWLSEEEYNRFKNADVTKYHLEWDDEHNPVLAEYGTQQWVEMKDGRIVASAGYRFSETCVKAEKPVVRRYDGGMYFEDDLPEKPQSMINEERIAELQNYLNETDWYAVRFAETGAGIPAEVRAERQAAREEISRLRGDNDNAEG